jgi:hypothetical protein
MASQACPQQRASITPGVLVPAEAFMGLPASGWPSPSTAWKEKLLDGEPKLFHDFARDIVDYQNQDAVDGKPLRGFHAKFHAGFLGEFQVLPDLPDHARHGVFAVPRTFPALVRFSNGDSHINRDRKHEPRGIAIKLIGVEGRKLLPGHEDDVTQDFLATSHSVTSAVRDVRQFMYFVKANRRPKLLMPVRMLLTLWPSETWRILKALRSTVLRSDVRSMATEEFSGTAPIKFGPYAVKFTVRPAPGTTAPEDRSFTKNFLRDELADRLRKTDVVFDFLLQFYTDDVRTPIEDTSVPWRPEEIRPWKVAQLRIPRCDLNDPQTREQSEKIDRLSFSPWHATEDHRPLGNVMRARRVAYEASADLRGGKSEPKSLPI